MCVVRLHGVLMLLAPPKWGGGPWPTASVPIWAPLLLLVFGLSQLPIMALFPIVFWFLLLHVRKEKTVEQDMVFNLLQLLIVFMTLLCVIILYFGVHTNLLFDVDMQVEGMDSYNNRLRWYSDQLDSTLPTPGIISFPLLVWRLLMLAWSFWLVSAIIRWASWGWRAFSQDRFWRWTPPRAVQSSVSGAQTGEKDVSSEKKAETSEESMPTEEANNSDSAGDDAS